MDAGKTPVLYSLVDLKDAPIDGYYYKQQLTKTRKPKDEGFFHVEAIIQKEKRGKHTYALVKYLHYPSKFNRWVKLSDIVK